jgi:hypothetical protein
LFTFDSHAADVLGPGARDLHTGTGTGLALILTFSPGAKEQLSLVLLHPGVTGFAGRKAALKMRTVLG